MIRSLYNIGKIYDKNNKSKSKLSDIIENPNESGKYPNVIKLNFGFKNNIIVYKGHSLEEFSNEKIDNYLYKRIGANAGDFTPTSRVTTFDKTIKNLIKSISKIESDDFKSLNNFLSDSKNRAFIVKD